MKKEMVAVVFVRVVCALVFTFLCSCSSEKSEVNEVGGSTSETTLFRWDFAEAGEEQVFTYQQQMEISTSIDRPLSSEDLERITGNSTLIIKSRGGGTADCILKDSKLVEESSQSEVKYPNLRVSGMKEDGSGPVARTPQDAMLRFLFPLPDGELVPGQSLVREIQFPITTERGVVHLPVQAEITLIGYDANSTSRIGQFEVIYTSGEPKLGDLPAVNVESEMNGKNVFKFDAQKNRYCGGKLNIHWAAEVEHSGGQVNSKPVKVFMKMNSTITLEPSTE